MQGVKEFKNKVFIKNNVIDFVNNLDFKNIANIYLLIKKNQEIPAHFTFGHLQAGNYRNKKGNNQSYLQYLTKICIMIISLDTQLLIYTYIQTYIDTKTDFLN